ncbi:MAG: RNA-binding S4 domain-containing protein [Thiovulaceae bacterium]|nr:RNA-binding S4 domain-containing protein [Sulfurimonadaceae bacterium]
MQFPISDEYIELYKLIKAADLVDSGAEAKHLIAEGHVLRNGEVELRKRAKILVGEVITIADASIEVTKK